MGGKISIRILTQGSISLPKILRVEESQSQSLARGLAPQGRCNPFFLDFSDKGEKSAGAGGFTHISGSVLEGNLRGGGRDAFGKHDTNPALPS